MAPMLFTKAILTSEPIKIFNNGEMFRDFTYIDDATYAITKLLHMPPLSLNDKNKLEKSNNKNSTPYRVINIGNNNSINLMEFIETLKKEINKKSIKIF